MNYSPSKIPPEKILAWISRHFHYKQRKNDEILIANPFYGNDNRKFNISLSKGTCHDWRGDDGWAPINPNTGKRPATFIKFVQLYLKCSYIDALKDVLGVNESLAAYLKAKSRSVTPEKPEADSVALPVGSEPLADATGKLPSMLFSWLATRGILAEDVAKYKLHYFASTVIWPYYEFDELVYWQSRSRMEKRFAFPINVTINGKEVGKGDFFFGFDQIEPSSYVLITEAIIDAMTLDDQTLASGGAILTKAQLKKLKFLNPKDGVILAADNDQAGIASILSNKNLITDYPTYYSIPPKIKYGDGLYTKDWNELYEKLHMSKSEIREIMENNIKALTVTECIKLRTSTPTVIAL